MNKTCWENLDFRYDIPSSEYVEEEFQKIDEQIQEFCKTTGINIERIEINFKSLKEIVTRIDMRQLYFHIYHKSMEPNEYKRNTGLLIFWILKLRPFWMKIEEGDPDNIIETATYINEMICLHIALSLLAEYNDDFFRYGKNLVTAYTNELKYSFRYRDLSKESMFLLFDPFYYLYFFNQSTQDGDPVL